MKVRHLFAWFVMATVLLAVVLCAQTTPFVTYVKTVTTNTVPEALTTDSGTNFRTIIIQGLKAARTTNAGTVWIGTNPTNNTAGIKLGAGESVTITMDTGYGFDPSDKIGFDPSDLYIDVETEADGVVAICIP